MLPCDAPLALAAAAREQFRSLDRADG